MSSQRSKNKQLFLNMGAQILAFIVNVGIGFFLTPYIIKTVGSTAYGFVGLANNFVSYVQILVVALNSMAGRFIAIHYYKNDYDSVQQYYASVLYSNLIISVLLSIPCTLIIIFIDRFVHVPVELIHDVRILWAFIFGAMLLSIVGSIFNNACYVMNRIELVSLRTVESYILRAAILIISFSLFTSRVWYVGMATAICTMYVIVRNVHYTKMLMPFVEFKKKYYDLSKVKELITSGIWNSVAQLGGVLSTGLDLLITNLFVGAAPMGIVSVAKTVPTYIQSMFVTVSSVFAPQLTITYAKNDKEGMMNELMFAMKLLGLFAGIPIAFVIGFGADFYELWVPSENARLLSFLTIAAVAEYPVTLVVRPLYNVFTTANKVKYSSLITIAASLSSCISVILLVSFYITGDEAKMMVVVGVSCLYNILKDLLVIPVLSARFLNVDRITFYPVILKSIIATLLISVTAFGLARIVSISGWLQLIAIGVVITMIGMAISSFIVLSEIERKKVINMMKTKLLRKGD